MHGKRELTLELIEGWIEIKGKRKRFLDGIEELIDWESIAQELECLYGNRGRPSYPGLMLFKMLIIQHFYNLSDPGCEEAVIDSLSFRRFCGLGIGDRVPDETTLVRFRQRLIEGRVHDKLLGLVNQSLEKQGLMVKSVTLVDATIVASANKPPKREEAPKDEAASFTRKQDEIFYGYKGHIGVDAATELIHGADYTTAKVHDSQVFDAFDDGQTPICADKAYWSKERHKKLGARSLLQQRARPYEVLTLTEKARNKVISGLRGRIEKVFGYFKRVLGYRRVRYRGLSKGLLEFHLKSICWNLRHAYNTTRKA